MFEAILSVIGVIAGWMAAWYLGYSVGSKDKSKVNDSYINLADGSKLQLWKGLVNPDEIFIAHNLDANGDCIMDGDAVVFDKYGHIIWVNKC